MRIKLLMLLIILGACNNNHPKRETLKVNTLKTSEEEKKIAIDTKIDSTLPISKIYSNERFKDVIVEKIDENKFRIQGLGQIFEASFNWIVEDGHEELDKGFEKTDAGAPEWGKFEFIIDVQKEHENSTLTLILFEYSAKDGSRQYELPIVLK